MEPKQAVADIIRINEHILDFWGGGGWAPQEAAQLLSESRLDWQVSLSRMLAQWIEDPEQDRFDAHLILAWANLGALVEGTMKWFLCVFYHDYLGNPEKKKDKMIEPDDLFFHRLVGFFSATVWTEAQRSRWRPFADSVMQKRNAIHAFQSRDLGSHEEFREAVVKYRSFLLDHEGQVPYPDEQYAYPFDIHQMHSDEMTSPE